ncbi:MAG: FAD-dependent oxidoreductase [Proteobacteria bacterium]|nr:FAD-dependent oxidoreductase [Pseudomonadota bacterium]
MDGVRRGKGGQGKKSEKNEVWDMIIIGGGPTAVGAGVYAAGQKLRVLVITEDFGGQSTVSSSIRNWVGIKEIAGLELAKMLEDHLRAQEGVRIKQPERVRAVREKSGREFGKEGCLFEVETEGGDTYHSKTVTIASGAKHRELGVPGEKELQGKGVAYCSTCDAFFYAGKKVVVVGSGNSALETVLDLAVNNAKEIYLLIRSPHTKGSLVNREKVERLPQVKIILNVVVTEVVGESEVTGVRYKSKVDGTVGELAVDGIFVAIGSKPNTEMVRGLVEMNEDGEIFIDHETARTSKKGIFAGGDATKTKHKQNNVGAAHGLLAALSAYEYLSNIELHSPCAEREDQDEDAAA